MRLDARVTWRARASTISRLNIAICQTVFCMSALPTLLRLRPSSPIIYKYYCRLDSPNFQPPFISSSIQTPPKFLPVLPVTISMSSAENLDRRFPEDAWRILKSLAAEWNDIADPDAVQVIPLKGAMTNEVYQIKWLTNSNGGDASLPRSRKVLVRIYGSGVDIFFDRKIEIRTFEFMSKKGHGPRLLGRFSNGRIEEFIRARTLTAVDLRDPEISALIASKMKEFHDLDMPGPKTVVLWERLRHWHNEAKRLSSPKESEAFRLDVMGDEISALEKRLSTDGQRIGFCHNDLQYGNIMMDEETRSITIIDYEYASYNNVAFDIANHFCEMAADYHTETPHLLDYNKYPGQIVFLVSITLHFGYMKLTPCCLGVEECKRFLHIYLSCSGKQHSDSEVAKFMQEVENHTLASHLFWGLWGIISEHVNKIDFDYIEYARQRFDQYWTNKSKLLESKSVAPRQTNYDTGGRCTTTTLD